MQVSRRGVLRGGGFAALLGLGVGTLPGCSSSSSTVNLITARSGGDMPYFRSASATFVDLNTPSALATTKRVAARQGVM